MTVGRSALPSPRAGQLGWQLGILKNKDSLVTFSGPGGIIFTLANFRALICEL